MPLLWLSLAFLAGIACASLMGGTWYLWLLPAGLSIFLTLYETFLIAHFPLLQRLRQSARLPLFILLASFFIGAGRHQLTQRPFNPTHLAWYNDIGAVRVIGVVVSPPDLRENATLLKIRATTIIPQDGTSPNIPGPVNGFLLARLPATTFWRYGDMIELHGNLMTPPEGAGFSYRDYLARQNIHSYINYPQIRMITPRKGNPFLAAIFALRQRSYQYITLHYPMPEAALLAGILLGIESDIPPDIQTAFQDTGTTHIIAISGFNIAILAGLIAILFNRIIARRWVSLLATVFAISAYTILVGAQPPVVRAAIMGSMGLMGRLIGRRQKGINSLLFTAALMCLFNPLLLWEPGFQLSFAATMGLILFADPLQSLFIHGALKLLPENLVRSISSPVGEYFLVTLAAQLTTLPVIIAHFHRLSVSLLLANILILPAQPMVMVLGGLSVLGGLLIPPVGQALSHIAWVPLAYTIRIVEIIARSLPGSLHVGPVNHWWIIFYYTVLLSFPWLWNRKWLSTLKQRLSFPSVVITISLATIVIWRGALAPPDGYLHMVVLVVPGGPALLIRPPAGGNILVNASSSPDQLTSALERWFSPFNHSIDLLLLTAGAEKSLPAVPAVIQRFPIKYALMSDHLATGANRRNTLSSLQRSGSEIQPLVQDQEIELGSDGVILRVIAESSSGTSLLLQWKNFRALVPGGVPLAVLEAQPQSTLGLSLLLLSPKDLTEGQSPQDWERLQPYVILYNSDQLPVAAGSAWLSAASYDWVSLSTNGIELWVEIGE